MISHYKQRSYLNSDNRMVSDRYSLHTTDDYKLVKLEKNKSLDELSMEYYDTPIYYWIIGEVNNIKDPFLKIKKGVTLKVPIL